MAPFTSIRPGRAGSEAPWKRGLDRFSVNPGEGMPDPRDVTELLIALRDGDRAALDELTPLVHAELVRIARRKLRLERGGHTLDTNALVNEAYLQLVRIDRIQWQSRAHFLAIAAHAMRNILVGYARRRRRLKRGGGLAPVSLSRVGDLPATEVERILDLDAALEKLAALNPRHAQVVEFRFFGGMTIEETATVLGISTATAKRDWVVLRGWLQRELERGG
jgi:RNA polymerase sigma factor (TIGR02999 family)